MVEVVDDDDADGSAGDIGVTLTLMASDSETGGETLSIAFCGFEEG